MFDLFFSHILSVGRFNSAMVALIMVSLVGMMTGPAGGNANPFLWGFLDRICGRLVHKTYNIDRSVASLQFRGALLLSLYLLITGIVAAIAILIERRFEMAGLADPFLLSLTLSGGATWSALIKLHHCLGNSDHLSKGSYYQVAISTKTNLNSTDDHGIIRVGLGFLATSLDKGMVAPLFWYLIGGLPGAYIYCGIAAARWSLSKDGFAKGIGTLALKLEAVFGVVPQILSAILIAFAALLTPTSGMTRTFIGLIRGKGHAPYAEGGLPVTALAYAMNISIGGPVEDISGSVLKRSWVGPSNSTARLERVHLRHAVYLGIMAYVLVAAFMISGILVWKVFTAM